MNVTYSCRHCQQTVRTDVQRNSPVLKCPSCGEAIGVPPGDFDGDQLHACLICGCQELFLRKDFSQRAGVTIVIIGFLLSTIAWGFHLRYVSYAILFATALIDVVLYFTVGNMLQCYRCQAEYRQLARLADFEPFDLETHERFRQQAIRLAQSKKD
jgi:hypothetical protein